MARIMISDAFAYPLRGSGRTLLIIGALLSAVLDLATSAPFVGAAAWALGGAYFIAYYFDIMVTTVSGKDEPPDFPEVSDLYGDILAPLIRSLGALLLALLPYLILTINYREEQSLPAVAKWLSLVFAAFYFPMAILNVAVGDEIAGALPHRVVPDIIRAMPRYMLLVVLLLVVVIVSDFTQHLSGLIPVAGKVIGAAVSLYFAMVQARMAAVFYVESLEKIDDSPEENLGTAASDAPDSSTPQS